MYNAGIFKYFQQKNYALLPCVNRIYNIKTNRPQHTKSEPMELKFECKFAGKFLDFSGPKFSAFDLSYQYPLLAETGFV